MLNSTSETYGPTSRPRGNWPLGLLGMLVLVAAVERTVARNELRFTTVMTSAWTQSGLHLHKAVGSSVVCFGDSLVKDGLVPPVLDRQHGLTAWNLALPKGMAPAHYFLLRRLLQTGSKPTAIVVDGEVLRDDPLAETRVWPELATSAECLDLARTGRDAPFFGRTLLARSLITVRARHEIRHGILSAFAGTTPPAVWTLATTWRNWNANRGAYVLNDRPETPGADPRLAELAVAGHLMAGWRCHPVNDQYVHRFLDLAEAHQIPVYWLLPPTHPLLQLGREQHGWDTAYLAYIRQLQAQYPRLTILDGRHAGYPASAMVDILHLGRTAAIAFTDSVGSVLRDPEKTSRWIELRPYDASSAARLAASSSTEDLAQSALAISGNGAIRR